MNNLVIAFSSLLLTSIYSLQFTDTEGNTVNMSDYKGKKILLVNIATNSGRVSQLSGLQQLHQQYGKNLVIIAFPSNSFGKEARSDGEIKQFCQANYGVTFKIAAKNSVSGSGVQSIYTWLANVNENGVMSGTAAGDFHKFLIDKNGSLIGTFAPSIPANDISLIESITAN
jgi:glutathione peroxidase